MSINLTNGKSYMTGELYAKTERAGIRVLMTATANKTINYHNKARQTDSANRCLG